MRKGILITLSILALGIITVLLIRAFVLSKIEKKVAESLESLNTDSRKVEYDSLAFDWKAKSITLTGLKISPRKNECECCDKPALEADRAAVIGISLMKIVFNRDVVVEEIRLDTLQVRRYKDMTLFGSDDNGQNEDDMKFEASKVTIKHVTLQQFEDEVCKPTTSIQTGIELTNIRYTTANTQGLPVSLGKLKLQSPELILSSSLYTVNAKEIRADVDKGIMAIDTIEIIPHLNREAFGERKGHDADHITGKIPFVHLAGIDYRYDDSLSLTIRRLETKFWLTVFRDKRLPHKNIYKPLPVEMIRKLNFGLTIDTLQIQKSYVKYEEMSEGATSPGTVYFDNLTGNIININNDSDLDGGGMQLVASAQLMGASPIKIYSYLPYNGNNARLKGSLRNFDFAKANPMIRPSTNVEVASGHLEFLDFDFEYNQQKAVGQATLNYHDLKVTLLKSSSGEGKKKEKDNFKSFLINTFIVKKTMDSSTPKDKRTGDIDHSRDDTRSIFNYWSQSLFSGLKDAFNLP